MSNDQTIIGVDLGGTHIRAGCVKGGQLSKVRQERIQAQDTLEAVLAQVFRFIDGLVDPETTMIGIGVPGLVEGTTGRVYDVVNIPAWKEVPLGKLLEERYGLPIVVNNDANCFALGEFHFGKGRGSDSMIGLTIGTGLGSGIIIHKKLYAGHNCGAGEFGMIPYLDQYYEYYASGQFFRNVYQVDGERVYELAQAGDPQAINMYRELGIHLGNAINTIQLALDTELIVLGGSVRKAFPFFSEGMQESLKRFPFRRSAERLQIKVSELEQGGILGAAALCLDRRIS
ncbi:MAG: ROK family protein [Flavisolibacter sp.]